MKFLLFFLINLPTVPVHAATKTLSIGIIQEWSAFNPVTSQLASNEALFPFIIRKMVSRSADGGVIPDIAENVPALKKNKAVWTIKPTARWGDGTPITCRDWHLGWKAGMNPKTSVEARSYYNKISAINWAEKAPRTCTVVYNKTDWSYDRDLPPLLPAHIEQGVFDKFKDEAEGYDRNTFYISSPTNKALYNGPYVVSEFKRGGHIILERNEHFYGSRPQLDRIVIKYISDTSALKANLLSGQINSISAVGFPPDTALMMKEEFKSGTKPYQVRFQNSGIFQGVYFNLQNPLLQDPIIREALSRAIDKEKITTAFFSNTMPVADGILSPAHPAYREVKPIYSKKIANDLLDKAGWKKNSQGVREKKSQKLSFTFKTSAGLKVLENIQLAICSDFNSIGVSCIIKNEPPRILLGRSVPRGDFDLAMYGQPIPADSSISSYFSSKEIPTAANSWAGGNAVRLNSEKIDGLLDRFDSENSRARRDELMQQINTYFRDQFLLIPLYHRREAIVMPQGLTGLKDSYDGTSFMSPEGWIW